jgi:hypothetical protein
MLMKRAGILALGIVLVWSAIAAAQIRGGGGRPRGGTPPPPKGGGGGGGGGGGDRPSATSKDLKVGDRAPLIEAGVWYNLPKGLKHLAMSDLKGQIVLVEFWATW